MLCGEEHCLVQVASHHTGVMPICEESSEIQVLLWDTERPNEAHTTGVTPKSHLDKVVDNRIK